jgi:hypothetical protein
MKGQVNCIRVVELINVGKLLCKVKCKWEHQATKIGWGSGEESCKRKC